MKLLLLHPLPLDGSIFSDGIRALGDGCVAPVLYGHGDDLRTWARAALDSVGDGQIVVVGNSIGGSCAVEVAHLAPKKVRALVLVGAKPGHRREPDLRDEALQVIGSGGVDAAWRRYWLPLFGPTTSPDTIERGRRVAMTLGPDAIADGVRAFHGRPDRDGFLRSWSGPVVIVSGQHDLNPERARRLAASTPNATFRLVAGAGHYVPLEDPDALTGIAREALRRAQRSSRSWT